MRTGRSGCKAALTAAVFSGIAWGSAINAYAQAGHGVSIFKECDGPICVGDTTSCDVSVAHADIFGDTTRILEAFDTVDPDGGNTRVPSSGNLEIVNVFGNTTCTVGGSLPCLIGAAGSTSGGLPGAPQAGIVTFRSEYEIQADDPRPLPDRATIRVQDVCDAPNTVNCSPSLVSNVQFTAETPVPTCDDGDDCTTDSCAGGVCSNVSVCLDSSFSCNDSDACTADSCVNDSNPDNACCSNEPIVCPAVPCMRITGCDPAKGCTYTPDCREGTDCCPGDGDDCDTESCNPNTGLCESDPICEKGEICCAEGESCDDTDECTEDVCADGCCENRPLDCDDDDACTDDSCDSAKGCINTPIDCGDDNDCTQDFCKEGKCENVGVDCDDDNECTEDVCKGGECENTPIKVSDNDRCTVDDCDPAKGPTHTPVVCDDNDECTSDSCDPADGKCVYETIDPPPAGCAGGDGCTPGFWKQPHHQQYWTGYSPSDSFDTVFGVTSTFGANTLLEVLEQGGGGEKALGRHAVSALLNSAHGDVDYLYDTAAVISMVQAAYASGDFSGAHALLAAENERGCTVVKTPREGNGGGKNKPKGR